MFKKDYDITGFTTFGISVKASLYAEYSDWKQLTRIARSEEYRNNLVMHIGGGSNLLFLHDFVGLVIHSGIKGITLYEKHDADNTVFAIAGAGEKWSDFVDYCVDHGVGGLENLAGIPGEVGASPVQNVGAYGVEAGQFIHKVECFDRLYNKVVEIEGKDCGFVYRDSKFKGEWKDRYFVLRVSFRLHKDDVARNYEYGALRGLADHLGHAPTIKEVRDAVLDIRDSKLPNPALIGSAGSFFKNPIVRRGYYNAEVLNMDPEVPCYDAGTNAMGVEMVKIPAGWLIDHAGLKGYRIGGAEVYPENALVIANRGGATAEDVVALAEHIRKTINKKYHVLLHPEVNYIDSEIRVTVLGSGTSKGIPEVGCDCDVCTSDNAKDKRLRCSVLVQTMGLNILIDPSPDFRQQALREGIRDIDAVLITHEHYDHVGGIDDLRPYCSVGPIHLYVREDVEKALRKRLDYCFRDHLYPGVPQLLLTKIDNQPFSVKGVEIQPIEVFHGKMPIYGFRIGRFAYITDAKHIDEWEKEKLEGLEVLIVNALRDRDHFAHFTIEEALALVKEVKPKHAYFTHLCHEAGKHDDLCKRLPDNVRPLYDGQRIVVK